jgi:hypothetical protein
MQRLDLIERADVRAGLRRYQGRWWAVVRLAQPIASKHVPQETEWAISIDEAYPLGAIEVFPSSERGITGSFQHQLANDPREGPARSGLLCLHAPGAEIARIWKSRDREPVEAEWRLAWHVQRALDWLDAAARDDLVRVGERFELPPLPSCPSPSVAFSEDARSLEHWFGQPIRHGLVELRTIGAEWLVASSWMTTQRKPVFEPPWGTRVSVASKARLGAWICVDRMPFVAPWGWPSRLGELIDLGGSTFEAKLRELCRHLRDGHRHHLLVGFPMPKHVGEALAEMHWVALELPVISTAKSNWPETTMWNRDRKSVLAASSRITWKESENWHPDRLGSRGRLSPALRSQRVLVCGVGALGSRIADLLVRGGVHDVALADGDWMEAGNLVRHCLGLSHLEGNKAEGMTRLLNDASPHATVCAITKRLPLSAAELASEIASFDVVIDCTAEDQFVRALGQTAAETPKLFVSASVGWKAERLYLFSARADRFPAVDFEARMVPWELREEQERSGAIVPWDGVGCFHPNFPADATAITLMAAVAVRRVSQLVESASNDGSLFEVYEASPDSELPSLQRVFGSEAA